MGHRWHCRRSDRDFCAEPVDAQPGGLLERCHGDDFLAMVAEVVGAIGVVTDVLSTKMARNSSVGVKHERLIKNHRTRQAALARPVAQNVAPDFVERRQRSFSRTVHVTTIKWLWALVVSKKVRSQTKRYQKLAPPGSCLEVGDISARKFVWKKSEAH